MGVSTETIKKNIDDLIDKGAILVELLSYSIADEETEGILTERLKKLDIDLNTTSFGAMYEPWYSEVLHVIKIFAPDRLNDFVLLYKNEKRKQTDRLTYTISDVISGYWNDPRRETALSKLNQQVSILKGALKLVDNVFSSLRFSIRADLFDSELDAAKELQKSGFYRAVGAMCGVVLEKHLEQVCIVRGVLPTKKNLTINDYNEALKNATIIDFPTWRNIQFLGDLRNVCCHDKKKEPTKTDSNDLLDGTFKITKTVF